MDKRLYVHDYASVVTGECCDLLDELYSIFT
jgi:hypothetical protein